MSYTIPPRLTSIFEERNRLAPLARGAPVWAGIIPSSDGSIGDAAHAASESDHNPDERGIVHADDVSQSMPGSPYWDQRCQQFDVFAQFHRIIDHWYSLDAAGRRRKYGWLKYFIWYEASFGCEAIWSPERASEGIRRNGNKQGHKEHGHISINSGAAFENDTQPIFITAAPEDDDMTPAEREQFRAEIKSDTVAVVRKVLAEEVPDLVGAGVKSYVDRLLGGYPDGVHYEERALLESLTSEARKAAGLSKKSP